jgi:hypothetical protein
VVSNAATDLAAELRAQANDADLVSTMRSVVLTEAADLLDAFAPVLALDWPCPTCGGTGKITKVAKLSERTEWTCPNPRCVAGQVSPAERVRQLIALREAVWDDDFMDQLAYPPNHHARPIPEVRAFDQGIDAAVTHLRYLADVRDAAARHEQQGTT